jgi:hypothetical protein
MALVVLIGTLSRSATWHAAFHTALEAGHSNCSHSAPAAPEGADTVPHDHEAKCALCLFSHGGWLHEVPAPALSELPPAKSVSRPVGLDRPSLVRWFTPTLERGPPAQV